MIYAFILTCRQVVDFHQFLKMLTKLRLNKSNVLALLEVIPCHYDSDTNVDENFDKDLDIT